MTTRAPTAACQAFVVVLGTNGLLIDDCPVYPAAAGGAPTTVPLPNNSILEVHKKRFRFAYPPKHLRTALAAIPSTPVASPGTRRRALRMSMITSAQVFSPRPFADPQRNLQVLQSPLKAVFKPEPESDDEEEEEEAAQQDAEEIVLVESDHPQVLESERDLVILDHVTVIEPPAAPPSPYRSPAHAPPMPVPPQNWAPPRTPARRVPRASLHRAVLIRSAQRAALRNEMQQEEEREAEEVESIMGEDAHAGMEDVEEEEFEEEVKEEEEQQQRRTPMSGWRKSLEAVKGGLGWAFRAASLEVRRPLRRLLLILTMRHSPWMIPLTKSRRLWMTSHTTKTCMTNSTLSTKNNMITNSRTTWLSRTYTPASKKNCNSHSPPRPSHCGP